MEEKTELRELIMISERAEQELILEMGNLETKLLGIIRNKKKYSKRLNKLTNKKDEE